MPELLDRELKLAHFVYYNDVVGMFKIYPCPFYIALPGAVSPVVVHNAFLWFTLTVPEVVDTLKLSHL